MVLRLQWPEQEELRAANEELERRLRENAAITKELQRHISELEEAMLKQRESHSAPKDEFEYVALYAICPYYYNYY